MALNIKNLFRSKAIAQPANIDEPVNVNVRGQGETYQQWGGRWAGKTNAASVALTPALNSVVLAIKQEQAGDEASQQQYKAGLQAEIDTNQTNIDAENAKIRQYQERIENLNDSIDKKQKEIANINEGNTKRPMAKIYFWIGAIITLALAIYLFVFYSSASYSAFFRSDDTMDVGNAIFYPQAFGDAWNTSIGQFLLILLMPVVFLGLGFLVHQYAKKKGSEKYLKTGVLYLITFIFDALLAFEISEKMYIPTQAEPNYTMSMAFDSPNFWIIIFAGFIAYVIWGLVFDNTMDAYSEMTEGRVTIKRLESEINEDKDAINALQQKIGNCNNSITQLTNAIIGLRAKLTTGAIYDLNDIKRELHNFFSGWIGYMTLTKHPQEELQDARDQLNSILNQLN